MFKELGLNSLAIKKYCGRVGGRVFKLFQGLLTPIKNKVWTVPKEIFQLTRYKLELMELVRKGSFLSHLDFSVPTKCGMVVQFFLNVFKPKPILQLVKNCTVDTVKFLSKDIAQNKLLLISRLSIKKPNW